MDRQTDTNMARSLEHLMVLFEGLVGHGKVKRDVINNTKKGIKNVTLDIKENVLLHEIEEIEEQLHDQSYNPLDIMGNLEHLLEEMDNFVQIHQHRLRRSSEQWTCSDLAIIVREYDYVINLLERINTFIRENILNTLDDQMDEEVKNFVTQTLAVYTDAEEQLKTKREPFVQYQTELSCDSKSSTEIEFVVSNFVAEISKIFDLVNENGNDRYLTKKSNFLFVLSRAYYGAGIGNMI